MNIGVFFGGKNTEHDISVVTGMLIMSTLKKLGHVVVPVYIDRTGGWNLGSELGSLKFFQQNPLPKLNKFNLDLEKSVGRMVFTSKGLLKKEYVADLAFPAFHGINGEDGTIQGLFELINLPYVGCDLASSTITIDKILTKQFFVINNFSTTKFVTSSSEIAKLKWPVFVKPAKLGSSIGIAKAFNQQELDQAVEVTQHYGERFLIEEAVENLMDVTCAVMGNHDPEASLLQESVFDDQLFSYEDKYLKDGGAQLGQAKNNIVIPARLDEKTTVKIRNTAKEVFKALGCSGIARVDFLYNQQTKEIFVNEVNTLPGTLYYHLWKASGIELEDVVTRLIKLASEKFQEKNSYNFTFESSLLNLANSIKLQIDAENKE